jgi:hypothetical protein
MNVHHFVKTYYLPLLFRPASFFRGMRCLFGEGGGGGLGRREVVT